MFDVTTSSFPFTSPLSRSAWPLHFCWVNFEPGSRSAPRRSAGSRLSSSGRSSCPVTVVELRMRPQRCCPVSLDLDLAWSRQSTPSCLAVQPRLALSFLYCFHGLLSSADAIARSLFATGPPSFQSADQRLLGSFRRPMECLQQQPPWRWLDSGAPAGTAALALSSAFSAVCVWRVRSAWASRRRRRWSRRRFGQKSVVRWVPVPFLLIYLLT